jgi:hypothetical protein
VTIMNFNMRQATRSVRLGAVAGLTLAALGASACGSSDARQGQTSSYMIINALEGQGVTSSGNSSGTFTPVLRSDVVTRGSVFEDNGRVTMAAAMRDAGNPTSPSPSDNNRITVTRYRVTFRRSDGRNTPGVDVPYDFDGAVTFTVGPGDDVEIPFSLVRAQAKLESPLMNLRGLGGSVLISTIADVTFFGRDQAGRETSVTGQISVNFADWGDPDN